MKGVAVCVVLLIAISTLTAADPAPWPQPGDTVFVSANLTTIVRVSGMGTPTESPVAACWPLLLTQFKEVSEIVPGSRPLRYSLPAPELVLVPDPSRRVLNAIVRGDGWLKRLHRTADECKAEFAKEGQPETFSNSGVQSLRPEEVPAEAAPSATPEALWPEKGDTVYLSAKLAGRSAPIMLGLKIPDLLPLDACLAVRILKRTGDSNFFRVKDESGERMLEGPWLSRMHRTAEECRQVLAKSGQPHIEAKGYRYLLIDDLPHD